MGKDDFLQLLVTQLSHQDPMNPMDGQEFAAQLAQFSSLEQLSNMNETLNQSLDSDVMLAQSISNNMAVGLIGHDVLTVGNDLSPDDSSINFQLSAPAVTVAIDVRDDQGHLVRQLSATGLDQGIHHLAWDGKDASGNPLPVGDYTFSVSALDGSGVAVSSLPVQQFTVEGIRYIDGQAWLNTGQGVVAMGDVLEVLDPGDPASSSPPDAFWDVVE